MLKNEKWAVANSGGKVIKAGIGHPETIAILEEVPLSITKEIQERATLISQSPQLFNQLKEMLDLIEEMRIRLTQRHGDKGCEHWDELVLEAIETLNKSQVIS